MPGMFLLVNFWARNNAKSTAALSKSVPSSLASSHEMAAMGTIF